jgi:hypothetical protein
VAQNIPATILGFLAGTGVSIAGGALLGSYVVTGIAPAYADPAPPRIRAERLVADEDTWPAPDTMAAVSGANRPDRDDADQAWDQPGVRASGSSRL